MNGDEKGREYDGLMSSLLEACRNHAVERPELRDRALIIADMAEEYGPMVKAKLLRLYARLVVGTHKMRYSEWIWRSLYGGDAYDFYVRPLQCTSSYRYPGEMSVRRVHCNDGPEHAAGIRLSSGLREFWSPIFTTANTIYADLSPKAWMTSELELFCDAVALSTATKSAPSPVGFFLRESKNWMSHYKLREVGRPLQLRRRR